MGTDGMTFDYSYVCQPEELARFQASIHQAHRELHEKTGAGADFTGWVELPLHTSSHEMTRIKTIAQRFQQISDICLLIGIGGSYLGARAAIEMCTHSFHNLLSSAERKAPQLLYLGHNLDAEYFSELFDLLEGKDVTVNVVSKSGGTVEPAVAFRMVRMYMEARYGKEGARERIVVTTERCGGMLEQLALQAGYEILDIPRDVGGRYSVLTPVGLFPMAVAGIDVDAVMAGAEQAYARFLDADLSNNTCYQYAAGRFHLYEQGKLIELFVHYQAKLGFLTEWWKQLFGESEGKEGKGIFPASACFTTDLHSLGQYVQEGRRHLFETVLMQETVSRDVPISHAEQDTDQLNYLVGKTLSELNEKAFTGTLFAHRDGGVPQFVLRLAGCTPYMFGFLCYFFQKACAVSGYLLGVNPFDQPGVEAYKRNMFALLGKSGYEEALGALGERV